MEGRKEGKVVQFLIPRKRERERERERWDKEDFTL
jgi:hypothetical protein